MFHPKKFRYVPHGLATSALPSCDPCWCIFVVLLAVHRLGQNVSGKFRPTALTPPYHADENARRSGFGAFQGTAWTSHKPTANGAILEYLKQYTGQGGYVLPCASTLMHKLGIGVVQEEIEEHLPLMESQEATWLVRHVEPYRFGFAQNLCTTYQVSYDEIESRLTTVYGDEKKKYPLITPDPFDFHGLWENAKQKVKKALEGSPATEGGPAGPDDPRALSVKAATTPIAGSKSATGSPSAPPGE